MIGILAACIFVATPHLAATGNEAGVWFIGDSDPTVVDFDPKTNGLNYSLCRRDSIDTYKLLRRFNHRPDHIVLHQDSIWCVDYKSSISLYSITESGVGQRPISTKVSLQSILDLQKPPTDVLSTAGDIIVCCGGRSLLLNSFDGSAWQELPTLEESNARVTVHMGNLMAAVPNEFGVTLWTLSDGVWKAGETIELVGTFDSILSKDDWPILVSIKDEISYIVGVQHGERVEIASCAVPKGRWTIVPSPFGLCMLGVQRNGTTTVLDIGWPSGENSDIKIMVQSEYSEISFFETYPFLLFMVACAFFLFLKFRKAPPNA